MRKHAETQFEPTFAKNQKKSSEVLNICISVELPLKNAHRPFRIIVWLNLLIYEPISL